jgi:protein-disulfide isomerase
MTDWLELIQGEKLTVKKGWIVTEMAGAKKTVLMAVLAMAGMGVAVLAQAPAVVSPATAEAQQAAEPQAPAPHAASANPFPAVNLKNFTADSPTTAEVNEFLKETWGYDDNRSWSVAAIQKTAAPGVAGVVVLVADKSQPGKLGRYEFFVTPDGKHAIAGGVVDFGVHPFADRRALLQQQANGAAEGAAGKDLLLVEFADLLNEKSKAAQDAINSLLKDIPQARVVFENLPAEGSPYALRAAAEGVCVRKAKGDAAFFTYMQTVFDKQKSLTATTLEAALDAATAGAGADPKSVDTCAVSPETKADVEASIALGKAAGVDAAPALIVNGRALPPTAVPYDTLKRIVAYQAQLDGIDVHVQPTLSNLK